MNPARNWIPYGKTWNDLCTEIPNDQFVGMRVRVAGHELLIGDINGAGGFCGCCHIGFTEPTKSNIIEAYMLPEG